jgi:hypothetical protein
MSSPIAPISPTPHGTDAEARRTEKLHSATREFEELLVKQLLNAAKIGGEKSTGYADMAVDALAKGVEKGGGLGLARRLEETLSHSLSRIREPASNGGG